MSLRLTDPVPSAGTLSVSSGVVVVRLAAFIMYLHYGHVHRCKGNNDEGGSKPSAIQSLSLIPTPPNSNNNNSNKTRGEHIVVCSSIIKWSRTICFAAYRQMTCHLHAPPALAHGWWHSSTLLQRSVSCAGWAGWLAGNADCFVEKEMVLLVCLCLWVTDYSMMHA